MAADVKDGTKGYKSGDPCPKCKAILEPRQTTGEKVKYMQCTRCSWNSMR